MAMTDIKHGDLADHTATPTPRTSLNSRLATILICLLVLAPLPLGSNLPVAWGLDALVVGAFSALCWFAWSGQRSGVHFGLERLRVEGTFLAVTCLWLVVQMLPIGPIHFSIPGGGTIESPTLSIAPGATLLMLVRMLTYAACFVVALEVSVHSRRGLDIMRAFYFVIVGYAVLGLFMLTQLDDTFFGMPKLGYLGVATATFVNRNSYATFLAFGLVAGVSLLIEAFQPAERDDGTQRSGLWRVSAWTWLTILGLPFIVAALAATGSRMGAFAGFAGCVVVAIIGLRGIVRWQPILLGAFALAALVAALFGRTLLDRFIFTESAATGRFALYREIAEMIRARPLLGYGGGTFEYAFPPFHAPPMPTTERYDHAHSTYLALWVDLGLVVGTLPMIIIALLVARAMRALRRNDDRSAVSLAGIGVAVVGAVHSLVDFSLEIEAVALFYVVALALAVARERKHPG